MYSTPRSQSIRYKYSSPVRMSWSSLYQTYYQDYARNRSPYKGVYDAQIYDDYLAYQEDLRLKAIYDKAYHEARANYDYNREGKHTFYSHFDIQNFPYTKCSPIGLTQYESNLQSLNTNAAGKTVEIVEERLNDVTGDVQDKHESNIMQLSQNHTKSTKGSKLQRSKSSGFIDTIVTFGDDGKDLKIANIVKIGDKYITKEWNCGDEWERKYGTRDIKKEIEAPLRSTYDNATGHLHKTERDLEIDVKEEDDPSVLENPTITDLHKDENMQITIHHEG